MYVFSYRRIFFVAVIPLLAEGRAARAGIGMLASLVGIALYNEAKPYNITSTNTLAYVNIHEITLHDSF